MKLLVSVTFCIAALAAFAQDKPNAQQQPPTAQITALHEELDGSLIRLNGNVEIVSGDMTLRADEAIYHQDTGEIDARGHVRLRTDKGEVTGNEVSFKPRPAKSR